MVKQVKERDDEELKSVDLISLLSLPENIESYCVELREPEKELDLVTLGKEEALAKGQASIPAFVSIPATNTQNRAVPILKAVNQPAIQPNKSNISTQSSLRPSSNNIISNTFKAFTAPPDDSFEKIIDDISCCKKCNLCQSRINVVPGVGNQHAKLVLIGEAPGADEDAQGIPFVGKAGQHLDKILSAAGFKKEDLYICNILKCRPPNNRDPKIEEMTVCTVFLQRQLALIKPRMIACLGNIATHYVISPSVPGITRVHGQWFKSIFGIPTFPMYHPSYLIRSESREKGSPNWQMWQDIRILKAKYDSLK